MDRTHGLMMPQAFPSASWPLNSLVRICKHRAGAGSSVNLAAPSSLVNYAPAMTQLPCMHTVAVLYVSAHLARIDCARPTDRYVCVLVLSAGMQVFADPSTGAIAAVEADMSLNTSTAPDSVVLEVLARGPIGKYAVSLEAARVTGVLSFHFLWHWPDTEESVLFQRYNLCAGCGVHYTMTSFAGIHACPGTQIIAHPLHVCTHTCTALLCRPHPACACTQAQPPTCTVCTSACGAD